LPQLVDCYETWQRQRFSITQGITGWWQINVRSDRPMHLHIEDDLYYIQHYSILLDIWILIRTIVVVLQGKGAF
ncbi:MAG: sugar transferase, partial [Anaerolineales bacterium]|nr:sugar transferase [Anaerolineales bacterium]